MSETTNKMRDVAIYSDSLTRVRDLAADAIEAVEAQVAEAVARVAAMEKRTVAQIPQERPACTGEDAGTARGGTGAAARSVPNAEGSPAGSTSPAAPSAVPAPRGFRVGDKVRTDQGAEHTISDVAGDGYWLNGRLRESGIAYRWPAHRLTLVRAPDAPEAPAEDAGLDAHWLRAYMAGETTRLDSPLVDAVRVFVDTKTKPLHVEIEKLRAKLAAAESDRDAAFSKERALRDDVRAWQDAAMEARGERDEFKRKLAAAEQALDVERRTGWTSYTGDGSDLKPQVHRTIEDHHAAEQSWWQAFQATRKERDALRAELDSIKGQYDAQTRSYNWVSAECGALRLASLTWFNEKGEPELLATAEEVTERRKAAAKELAALRAKPRFRTRKVRAKDAEAFDKEYYKREYAAGYEDYARAMNAVGLRMRVDGAK